MRYLSILRYFLILSVMLCVSCGTALPTVKPYKLDVQQGNVVTSKMLLQLRPGMTKSQVRFIMGTPLIQDSFHGNRWDYVYQLRENGKISEQRRVILDFESELLKIVRGDVAPTGSDKLQATQDATTTNTGTRVVKPTAKAEDKGLIDKLKFWKKDDAAKESADIAKDLDNKGQDSKDKDKKELAINPGLSKDAPTPSTMSVDSAPPVEETKSILVVPLESAVEAPPVSSTAPETPKTEPVVSDTPVASELSTTESLAAAPAVVLAPVKAAVPKDDSTIVKTHDYQSPAGMQFDRTLRTVSAEASSEAKPTVAEPRAGNKTVPKPKDLPPEGSSGFFDRMLEKIGF